MIRQALEIPLNAISFNPHLQPRCDGLNEDHVLALMESADRWDPILVVRYSDDRLILVGGAHRLAAAQRLGLESLPATVIDPPPDNDLFRLAFEDNVGHGLPPTLKDRKAYATRIIQSQPDLFDREIGRRAGINHETVRALRYGDFKYRAAPDRKPGEIESDIGLTDHIRWAKGATRQQKAVAGFVARVTRAVSDPYTDKDEPAYLAGWPDDPQEIAQACFAAMGADRALQTLAELEPRARFLTKVAQARKTTQIQ